MKSSLDRISSSTKNSSTILAKDAQKWDADLIVLGTHGRRGLDRLFLGSVAETLVRMAPTPVLLARAKTRAR